MGMNYMQGMHEPGVIDVCMSCERDDCDGICDAYKDRLRAVLGLPPAQNHPKRRVKPMGPPRGPKISDALASRKTGRAIVLTAFGETRTLLEWAEWAGMSYNTLYMRLYRGEAPEAALRTRLRPVCVPGTLEVNGVRRTIREWSEATGLSRRCIYGRMERGWTAEEAVSVPALPLRRAR